ncbi:MAG: cobalt ECF transporter T component CbiQ [Nitrospirota bacterium]
MIPEWLLKDDGHIVRTNKKVRITFVEKTMSSITHLIEDAVLNDRYACIDRFLQRLDPRAKVLSTVCFILLVTFTRRIEVLLGISLLSMLVSSICGIKPSVFIRRAWILPLLFTGVIIIPSIFNIITPGDTLVTLFEGDGIVIAVTEQGLWGAITLVLRVMASVSLVTILTMTTRWSDLLASLKALRMPRIFILILEMSYRYIFHLLRIVEEIHIAKKSRTLSSVGMIKEWMWSSSGIGMLFLRSYRLSVDVHNAMLSRGFTGEVQTLNKFKIRRRDIVWCVLSVIITTLILVIEYGTNI